MLPSSSKPFLITGLVVVAAYTVFSNIISPLMEEEQYATERPDMLGFEDEVEDEVVDAQSHALTPVNINVLFWNDVPSRDPYVYKASMGKRSISASRQFRGERRQTGAADEVPRMAGFIAGEASRLAVVDNKIVKIGQRVGSYTVLDIDPQGVHLVDRKNRTRLKLKLEH